MGSTAVPDSQVCEGGFGAMSSTTKGSTHTPGALRAAVVIAEGARFNTLVCDVASKDAMAEIIDREMLPELTALETAAKLDGEEVKQLRELNREMLAALTE